MVDDRWSPRSHELRDLLQRGGIPFAFHPTDSDAGRAVLREVQHPAGPFPVLVRFDGHVLTNPEQRGARPGARRPAQLDGRHLRRPRHRGRAGRTVGGRLRRIRRAAHHRRRPRLDRRTGWHQLAHPQLPRLPPRHRRRRTVQPGAGPGLVVRRRDLRAASRDRAARRRPTPDRRTRRRRRDHRPYRGPGDRSHLPPARHSPT